MEGGWSLHSPALARIHDRLQGMFLLHTAGFLDDSSGKPIPRLFIHTQILRLLWLRGMSFTHHTFWYCFSGSCKPMDFVRNPEYYQ
jgi:hypothetical protein